MNRVEIFLMEIVRLQIRFRLPTELFSRMYLYWEQSVSENCFEVTYSLYVANVVFRDFIDSFRNIGCAQNMVARIKFLEELFNVEQSRRALLNRTYRFEPPSMVFCQHYEQIYLHFPCF